MDNQPLVSILIPNYNKAPYLRETLDSVLAQTYTHWECIIVDDHSNDDSWEIIEDYAKKDSRFKIYRRPDHLPKGGNAARNYAFQLSKGEYVNWFDSDDVMKPDFIAKKVDHIKNKNLDAVISRMLKYEDGTEIKTSWIPDFDCILDDYLLKDIHFHTSGPMFSKDFLLKKKLFNSKIKVGQEKEFFFRLLCQGMKFMVLDEYLMVYFERKNGILDSFKEKADTLENWRYRYGLIDSTITYNLNIKSYKHLVNLWAFKILKLSIKEFEPLITLRMIYVLTRNKLYV